MTYCICFVNLQNTFVYYSTGVCCNVLCFFIYFIIGFNIFFNHYINYVFFVGKNWECLHNIILLYMDSYFEQEGWQKLWVFTKHISTPNRFHILRRKDGKNGKYLLNIFLLHINFIFWAGRMAKKTANVSQHISTPCEFHIFVQDGWKKRRMQMRMGMRIHNIFLLHMKFIFWTGRVAKAANVYTTYFCSTWISYFEQEGRQERWMFTQHVSTPHEFHILYRKGGKNSECYTTYFYFTWISYFEQ